MAATAGGPYKVPRRHDGWRSFALAVAMHALLFVFLWGGIRWQNTQPVAVEAEVWDLSTQQAAPPPQPQPEPEPQQEPEPEPAPPPPTPAAPPEKVAPQPDPEIALRKEREKKEKERQQQLAEEKRKQAEEERKLLEQAKKKEEQKRQEELAEQKKQEEAKKKKELAAKAAAEAKAKKEREDNIRRMTAGLGTAGTAEKSTAPRIDGGYLAALRAKIQSNVVYAGTKQDIEARFRVTQLPTGEVISVRKIKSSGNPAYDTAVENAINKSSPLPKKKDGTVEKELELVFNMKDLP